MVGIVSTRFDGGGRVPGCALLGARHAAANNEKDVAKEGGSECEKEKLRKQGKS